MWSGAVNAWFLVHGSSGSHRLFVTGTSFLQFDAPCSRIGQNAEGGSCSLSPLLKPVAKTSDFSGV
jgi:hypothetical protein